MASTATTLLCYTTEYVFCSSPDQWLVSFKKVLKSQYFGYVSMDQGASKVALRADFGVRSMGILVWKENIFLILHIRNLEESALAKMMWRDQLNNNWPGLLIEAKERCAIIGVEDVNTTMTEKAKYVKIVREACRARDETEIKKEMTGKKV